MAAKKIATKKITMRLEEIEDFTAKEAFEEWKSLGTKKRS